jgi:uncharacterized surface protein with fasciclin (FAS1) repeats
LTILAPSNSAFAKIDKAELKALLEDRAALTEVRVIMPLQQTYLVQIQ